MRKKQNLCLSPFTSSPKSGTNPLYVQSNLTTTTRELHTVFERYSVHVKMEASSTLHYAT